jgi:phenylacetate-coenzyme A ligase PaaK-like adenylate-forming protein
MTGEAPAPLTLDPVLRERHRAAFQAALPGHLERLRWSRPRIAAFQRERLRALLRHARQHSPFHAQRLSGIDPERFELADLAQLPVMTKTEMMARFDDVVTDRRLTRALVERHVAATGPDPAYLLGEYLLVASGGSSGERGVFAYGWDAAVDFILAFLRVSIARLAAQGGAPPPEMPMAMVAAGSGVHATRAFAAIFASPPILPITIPVTLPLPEIVARLNALQPLLLQSYPSALSLLAEEQRAGRLRIRPLSVTSTSELFAPETRARVESAFGVPAVDQLGSSEGVLGLSAPGDPAIALAEDLAIVELVDEEDRPVPPGTPSAKALVTNLMNPVQPLIRYELTDRFVRHPDAAEHGYARVTLEGRQDDLLHFGDRVVHPLVVRTVLVHEPAVVEYQVRQTPSGVDVDVIASGPFDRAALARELAAGLAKAGLARPEVRVGVVEALPRHPETGKTKRFVPLARG